MYQGPKHYFGDHPLSKPHPLTQEEAEAAALKDQKDAEKRLLIHTELSYSSDCDGSYVRVIEVER